MTTTPTPGGPSAAAEAIRTAATSLGIELGSTRIKAVLIGPDRTPLAQGSHMWDNHLVDGVWTYDLDEVWAGLQAAIADLASDVRRRHDLPLTRVGALGVSAMMHGYLALDGTDALLVPFRTWRNTSTGPATDLLGDLFDRSIPHRWSIAHHCQAVLDAEPHVAQVAHLTTLAGLVHHRLSGERVLGVGDASGMFPVDGLRYDPTMVDAYDGWLRDHGIATSIRDLLPAVLPAGAEAGRLTTDGALLLDPTGTLQAGALMCPPEGDAGTGMVATGAVTPRTGNVSVGTSIFAMVVLESPLVGRHPEIDLVTTPAGDPVAMVHANNGASEIGAWAGVFGQFAAALGHAVSPDEVFTVLFAASREAAPDAGGLTAFNYLSGEPITRTETGHPLVIRTPDSTLSLANLVRAELYGAFTTLALGMDVLRREGVDLDLMVAHGGLFTTPGEPQAALAAALGTAVALRDSAATGGAWGIALLADFALRGAGASLAEHLRDQVFAGSDLSSVEPDPALVQGFSDYLARFTAALPAQRALA